MFGWLFGRKKKNSKNINKSSLLKSEISQMTPRKRVQTLRRLRKTNTYSPDFNYMYGDDLMDDLILFYLLMEMADVVSECDAGFYEVEDAVVERESMETVPSIGEEAPVVETIEEPIVDEVKEPMVEETVVEAVETEPTPIAVEEPVAETPSFEEKTSSFGDTYEVEDTSSSFGDSFGSDSGGSDFGGGDCGGSDW